MRAAALSSLVTLVAPELARACSVCYGAAEGNVIEGARAAIVFMLALTYVVLLGGIGMVFVVRRRASRQEEES